MFFDLVKNLKRKNVAKISSAALIMPFPISEYVFDLSKLKLLLVQHSNGQWGLPAGHSQRAEHPELIVEREIKEETGYIVKPTNLFWINPISRKDKNTPGSLGFVYWCDILKIEGEGSLRSRFFTHKELGQLLFECDDMVYKSQFNFFTIQSWMLATWERLDERYLNPLHIVTNGRRYIVNKKLKYKNPTKLEFD